MGFVCVLGRLVDNECNDFLLCSDEWWLFVPQMEMLLMRSGNM